MFDGELMAPALGHGLRDGLLVNIQAFGLILIVSFYKPMADNDVPGAWPVYTPGARLAGFIKITT